MKTKVNLTIEKDVLLRAKEYASEINESLSGLVEEYLKSLEKSKNTRSFVDYVENLKVPSIPSDFDFKKEYYLDKSEKYGQ
ncbi:MAG: DUF6364 family protein [Pelobium sp.]